MRVGVTLFMQGYEDWDRYEASERGVPGTPALDPEFDRKRYQEEIAAALELEDMGYDSIWTVEHHVAPYTMITNPIQFLTFLAGATKRVDVGTMVAVIPWHHPLRLAEDIVMLQYALRGRTPYIGFGRGAAIREFTQLGLPMDESKERFKEGFEIIKLAIENERFSYAGKHYNFKDVTMRPRPLDPNALIDNFHFSWGTPASAPVGAELGLKPMIIPQRAVPEYVGECRDFAAARKAAGHAPANPRLHLNCFVAETHEEAEKYAALHIPEYGDSAIRNYQITGDHFAGVKGYEFYAERAKEMQQVPAEARKMLIGKSYLENHAWGTPDEVIERLTRYADILNPEEYMLVMRYGSMPDKVARKSTELFARKVLPEIQKIKTRPAA